MINDSQPVRTELVEVPTCFFGKKEQGFDKLSPNGFRCTKPKLPKA